MNITDQHVAEWFGYMIASGTAFVLLLWALTSTDARRRMTSGFLSWLGQPSAGECQRVSDEMLADLNANVAAKRAVTAWNVHYPAGTSVAYEPTEPYDPVSGRVAVRTLGPAYVKDGKPVIDVEQFGTVELNGRLFAIH